MGLSQVRDFFGRRSVNSLIWFLPSCRGYAFPFHGFLFTSLFFNPFLVLFFTLASVRVEIWSPPETFFYPYAFLWKFVCLLFSLDLSCHYHHWFQPPGLNLWLISGQSICLEPHSNVAIRNWFSTSNLLRTASSSLFHFSETSRGVVLVDWRQRRG